MAGLFSTAALFFVFLAGTCFANDIVPGATWTVENTHEHMQAHGTGIIYVDGYYYAVGENKTYTSINTSGSHFNSVACYRSKDLTQWEFVNNVLSQSTTISDLGSSRVVERPKIIYNELTDKYVMWMHIDSSSYGDARAGVATCDTVCGDYTYLGSSRPLGHISRDLGLYVDDDSTAYLLSEDRENGARIYELSANYTVVINSTVVLDEDLEAPAVVKVDGVYYFFGSKLSGWSANDNRYSTATSLSGPWADFTTFAPVGKYTYSSQTTFVLPITDSQGEAQSYLYMGDRWYSSALWSSRYIWLPLTLDSSARTASMTWYDHFKVDLSTGEISVPSTTTYEAEDATLSGTAAKTTNTAASDGYTVGPIGGSNTGSITWDDVTFPSSGSYTIGFNYTNTGSNTAYANLTINGETTEIMAFLTTSSGAIGTSVWQYSDYTGSGTVELSGSSGSYSIYVDKLIIYS